MGGAEDRPCDVPAATVFTVAIVAGTVCIIASKALLEGHAHGSTGELEPFQPPVFESFIMFFGMIFALPLYAIQEGMKRWRARTDPQVAKDIADAPKVTTKMLLMLALPALLDLSSVLLLMTALTTIPASLWMLLRGGAAAFCALVKMALGDKLSAQKWVGIAAITVAVMLGALASTMNDAPEGGDSAGASDASAVLVGVLIALAGTFMSALQYVFEEKAMDDMDVPPWLLIGMEGFYGSLFTVIIVYPIAGVVPGSDHGVFEDLENTMYKLADNPSLIYLSALFCASVFVLNSFSVLVTFMLSSVWHAILDNFRPISIWATQLVIFVVTSGAHGEPWSKGSPLQLVGLAVMLLGTAIYNGKIQVPGLAAKDLLKDNDPSSTPALTRSPMLTHNASPGNQFGAQGSPYAPRAHIGGPSMREPLVEVVRVR